MLQLMNVQNLRIICVTVLFRFTGNSNALFKMAESLQHLMELFIFSIFRCLRIKIYPCGSDLLLNISLSVSRKIYPLFTTDLQPVIYTEQK